MHWPTGMQLCSSLDNKPIQWPSCYWQCNQLDNELNLFLTMQMHSSIDFLPWWYSLNNQQIHASVDLWSTMLFNQQSMNALIGFSLRILFTLQSKKYWSTSINNQPLLIDWQLCQSFILSPLVSITPLSLNHPQQSTNCWNPWWSLW